MLGHPWGKDSPWRLPASAVLGDGVLMRAGSAALVVTGEQGRGREQRLERVLKPIVCPGRANPVGSAPFHAVGAGEAKGVRAALPCVSCQSFCLPGSVCLCAPFLASGNF